MRSELVRREVRTKLVRNEVRSESLRFLFRATLHAATAAYIFLVNSVWLTVVLTAK